MISGSGDPSAWWSTHGPEAVLAYRIRTLRRARDWSQGDLAAKMKDLGFTYHQNTVSRIESGSQSVTLNEAAALAMIFSVGADELLMPGRNEEAIERLVVRMDQVAAALRDSEAASATAGREAEEASRAVTDAQMRLHMAEKARHQLMSRRLDLTAELDALHRQLAALEAGPPVPVNPGGES